MTRILIVEDEPDIALGLKADLKNQGYEVEAVADGATAIRRGMAETWDLILLDIMLPNIDGYEVCRRLRRERLKTPIIMLTAKVHEAEKILGLELGADDYVTKPFSPPELRARIKAVLRRFSAEVQGTFQFGDCDVDFDRAELRQKGRPVEITALEFRLLSVFIRHRGRVLTRAQLIDTAWDPGTFINDRVVDTHILNLRKKIEPVPAEPRYLLGVRGIGYRFDG